MSAAVSRARLNEGADDYPRIVAHLNARWRVIECRDRIQWILQYRASAETYAGARWAGRSYCRTSEALRRCCKENAGMVDASAAAILSDLPAWIEEPTKPPKPAKVTEPLPASDIAEAAE
jgi:hypothetical protein